MWPDLAAAMESMARPRASLAARASAVVSRPVAVCIFMPPADRAGWRIERAARSVGGTIAGEKAERCAVAGAKPMPAGAKAVAVPAMAAMKRTAVRILAEVLTKSRFSSKKMLECLTNQLW